MHRAYIHCTNLFFRAEQSLILWPILACLYGWSLIAKRFDHAVHFDAQYVYLPAAQSFLEQGWSFFLTPDSYRVVPLAYLWPALWGGDPSLIRLANGGLWVGCVFFLWNTCLAFGGIRAAVVAMLLWALHPEIPRYFSTELTEPIFLFSLFGWIHALARMVIQRDVSRSSAVQGALMLAMTLMSRPVLQIVAPAALILITAYLWLKKFSWTEASHEKDRVLRHVAWSLAWGMVLPFLLILKNGIVFGLWGLGTGAGTGLYLGTHPLFQGTEPAFLGFGYDINALVALKGGEGDHLSLVGDRAARAAALWQMKAMTIPESLSFYSRKIWWWLMHHPAQVQSFGSSLRKIRIFEISTVLFCGALLMAHHFRKTSPHPNAQKNKGDSAFMTSSRLVYAAIVLTIFLLMLAQLTPILYNSRYSSALLDPWLIVLTSFSIAYITHPIRLRLRVHRHHLGLSITSRGGSGLIPVAAFAIALAVIIPLSYRLLKQHERVAVDPLHLGKTATHLDATDTSRIETYGMEPLGEHSWIVQKSPAALHIRVNPDELQRLNEANPFNALWTTEITLEQGGKEKCRHAEISYRSADGRILQPAYKLPLLLPLDQKPHAQMLVTHANDELRPRDLGSLRIVLHCPQGTLLQWHRTQLLESRYPWDAASHILPQ